MQNKLFSKLHLGIKKSMALALAATTLISSIPTSSTSLAATVGTIEEVPSYTKYYEPFSLDADRDGKAETIWSTFTYGEYPQSQVTNTKELAELEAMSEDNWYPMENPYITYTKGADAEQTIAYGYYGNDCYLRMKMTDTNCGSTTDRNGYYTWEDADTYHYFKFEPITWRILSVGDDGTNALAISDQVLDCQVFNYTSKNMNFNGGSRNACDWKYSTLRSFMNSYDATCNAYKADYSEYGFKFLAFGDEELANIPANKISNKEGAYANIYGSSTMDQFFCLSYNQLKTTKFGFNSDEERTAYASDYAKQLGAFGHASTSFWWTRSAGNDYKYVSCVDYMGDIHKGGDKVSYNDIGVRPAMYIDLTKVSSDAFTGYVDAKGNAYSNKVTFKLDGAANAYALVNKKDGLVNLPYKYEKDGYDYTYTYGNKTLSFPMHASKNFTVTVNRKVQENAITVYYKASSSWSKAYIHYKLDNGKWTTSPGMAMEATTERKGYTHKYVINGQDAENITLCFNNGNGTWDNKNKANYKLNLSEGSYFGIANTTLKTLPENPVENTITVYYNTSWTTPYIHFKIGSGNWTKAPGVAMEATTEQSGYNFKYVIHMGEDDKAVVCFNNGNNSWDSKNGSNYTLSSSGVYGIKNKAITALQ